MTLSDPVPLHPTAADDGGGRAETLLSSDEVVRRLLVVIERLPHGAFRQMMVRFVHLYKRGELDPAGAARFVHWLTTNRAYFELARALCETERDLRAQVRVLEEDDVYARATTSMIVTERPPQAPREPESYRGQDADWEDRIYVTEEEMARPFDPLDPRIPMPPPRERYRYADPPIQRTNASAKRAGAAAS